ncbi:hypothetical protein GCM10010191_89210 [Actinomadura vinacea]|uniref:ParA family protein n=1 Tax=Actinomadura vinacea TaxID=115336 RepID=A0ABN3KCS3_9ACTN
MALYCVISAGGAPGATTTALGLALTWPGKVLLAECDPAGRRVLSGFMADRLKGPAGPGLLGLAMAVQANPNGAAAALEEYTLPLTQDGEARLLHGIHDPRQVRQLARLWRPLADTFMAQDGDVIADLGRVGGAETPVGLLEAADVVVMVLRPTLGQVDAALPRLEVLREVVGEGAQIRLCLIDDGAYSAAEVQRVLGHPITAELPCSPPDARVLSDGAAPRLTFNASLLMRGLETMGRRVRKAAEEAGRADASSEETDTAAQAVQPSPAAAASAGGGR